MIDELLEAVSVLRTQLEESAKCDQPPSLPQAGRNLHRMYLSVLSELIKLKDHSTRIQTRALPEFP